MSDLMPPQAFYIVPVSEDSSFPKPQPPGYPSYPSNELPGSPVDPGWGGGWGGGNYPSHGLPRPPHYPTHGPVFPPIYPVDPGWGVGEGGGVKHPLLWLLPWLIKPATTTQSIPPPPSGDKPDPDGDYVRILVAVGPGAFKWGWIAQEPTAAPKA